MKINAIILAAGQGTRMQSNKAKVLHTVGGQPMLGHVLKSANDLNIEKCLVVYGHDGEQVMRAFKSNAIIWVHQSQQLGTAHAVQQAMSAVDDDAIVIVLYGDTPLVRSETLTRLLDISQDGVGLLTTVLEKPDGYGRIIRDANGNIMAIVEHKDASPEQLTIKEVNTGIVAMRAQSLNNWLGKIENDNAQQEYYLTDVIALAVADGVSINAHICKDSDEVMGINNRIQQAEAERVYQLRQVERQMLLGVAMSRPETITINGELVCGHDVRLEQNVILNGTVTVGNNVSIGASCVISNSIIADNVVIQPFSVIDSAQIGDECRIGPFARIRPEAVLAEQVHIGNFVEIKKSSVAARSKINHLSYIGDTSVGHDVNVGAGTITCNYDGVNKHQTVIEDNVFIGSDTQIIAPVTIGAGSTIAAGSTITRNVEKSVLVLSRVPQKTVADWKRPVKDSKQVK